MSFSFSISSTLPNTTKEEVFQHIITMKGVNEELYPFTHMTFPSRFKVLPLISSKDNTKPTYLFTSILLNLGFIPADLHFLRMQEVVQNEGFRECSFSLLNSQWNHVRKIEQDSENIVKVTDIVAFTPRWFVWLFCCFCGIALLKRVFQTVFENRHKKLRSKFHKS